MKKTILSNVILFIVVLAGALGMVSCDTPYTLWKVETGFCIFRFKDTQYMEYALVNSVMDSVTGNYVLQVPATGRRQEKQYFFTKEQFQDYCKQPVSPCEIADAQTIYYPLHEGFYLCFPYNRVATGAFLSTCKWSDLCNANMDTAHVMLPASEVFKNIYGLSGEWASSYLHKRAERLTLEDVVKYANLWIDKNKDNSGMWLSPDGGYEIGIYERDKIQEGRY